MTPVKSRTALILVATIAIGCANYPLEQELEQTEEYIRFGVPDVNNEYPTVGALLRRAGNGWNFACTATLVRENKVLTAGHCVADVLWPLPTPPSSPLAPAPLGSLQPPPPDSNLLRNGLTIPRFPPPGHAIEDITVTPADQLGFWMDTNQNVVLEQGELHLVSDVLVPSFFVPDPGGDLAVLVLEQSIPGFSDHPMTGLGTITTEVGTMVGIGRQEDNPDGTPGKIGEREIAVFSDRNPIASATVMSRVPIGALGPTTPIEHADAALTYWNFTTHVAGCPGDSGAPVFVTENGDTVIAGVLSTTTGNACNFPNTFVQSKFTTTQGANYKKFLAWALGD